MWLENLIELKKRTGMSSKQIAEGTLLPERTVTRIFHRETDSPTITTLIPIIKFLGGSFDEIFADTKAVVSDHTIVIMQEKLEIVTAERDSALADNISLKEQLASLNNELLLTQLTHKDEIIELYKLLFKHKQNDSKGE